MALLIGKCFQQGIKNRPGAVKFMAIEKYQRKNYDLAA